MNKVTTEATTRNGVDTATLFATLDAVSADPSIADFRFRAHNRWVSGTHSQGRISGFYGAGQDMSHLRETVLDADHPQVLVGKDTGPTPVEYVLHALAACLTAGLVNIAAVRGITLTAVESTVEGDIDLMGILGLSESTRNGFSQVRVHFTISGDAPEEVLRNLLERSAGRSAVLDVVTNGVPVTIDATVR